MKTTKTMKRIIFRTLLLTLLLTLIAGTAAAEWKKKNKWVSKDNEWVQKDVWTYYGTDGKEVTSFGEMKSIIVPDEVDELDHNIFKGVSRDFYLECNKDSYAEQYAKQYGFQYDNGVKKVIGYQIDDIEKKANWIIDNYVVDNYKGSRLTDKETALVLHDWLTTNATYDYYGLDVEQRENTYKAEGVLLDGTGVCDSYAQAYSYLLNKVGIQNRYIAGDTGGEKNNTNHAWDLVLIDGQWQFVDVTWDDAGGETAVSAPVTTGYEGYQHFLISDEEMHEAGGNRIWDPDVSADDNAVGFVFTEDGTYYYGDKTDWAVPTTGWVEVEHNDEYSDAYYWMYDPNKNQKLYEQEGKYYFTEDGTMAVGWEDISKDRYYFSENGLQRVGWLTEDKAKYHLDEKTGAMDKGWTDLMEGYRQWNGKTGEWEDKTGVFTYFFGDDGKMRVGFADQNGKTYFLSRDNGRMEKDRWISENSGKYHASEDGALDKGWTDLTEGYRQWNGNTGEWEDKTGVFTYFFDNTGRMQTGFVDARGEIFHLSEDNGRLDKNAWIEADGETYHAGATGALDRGFTTAKTTYLIWNRETRTWDDVYAKFYFDKKGKMKTGLFRVDGTLHYAESNGEVTDDLTDGFVARCYQLILGREADRDGLKGWSNRLKNGTSTAAEIVRDFVNSAEFNAQNNSEEQTVEVLYNTMLGRESDAAGKEWWAGYLTSGCSDGAVINGFCGSQEFQEICKEFKITAGSVAPEARDYNRNLTAFVDRCYSEALNRAGEPSGLNYWCEAIINSTQTPKQVASGFVFSREMAERNLSAGETIDMLYRLYLGRPADPAGRAYWVDRMQNGMTLQELNDGFADSAEFGGIVAGYGLQ